MQTVLLACLNALLSAERNRTVRSVVLGVGATFGECSALLEKRVKYSVFADTFCDVYALSSEEFLSILEETCGEQQKDNLLKEVPFRRTNDASRV